MAIKFYKLLDILNKREMSKSELCKLAGISTVTMSKISKGGTVTTEMIDKICTALDVQPGDIMEHVSEDDNK
jgi:DNA-binding Xre family transcriptional regulator